MRRRPRIDLGQETSAKTDQVLERKGQRWAARNPDRPEDNPFFKAISPDHEHYGEADEKGAELMQRLNNLEFGNFPGYFNYRNKAAADAAAAAASEVQVEAGADDRSGEATPKRKEEEEQQQQHQQDGSRDQAASSSLEAGLSDERLEYLSREWFEGKEVLDIGCNRGHITYAIARLFLPRFIVGIDIDIKMVNMANKDLHLHLAGHLEEARELRRQRALKGRLSEAEADDDSKPTKSLCEQFPLSCYISDGPLAVSKTEPEDSKRRFRFPNNLLFIEHNYVLSRDELVDKQRAHFDTIVCLSVTKWIHLNYRDDGLKRFFRRIYKHLRPGGLLILEAQPYDNYGRRKRLSDRLRANYYSIQFKPDQFDAYLLSEQVGFREIIHGSVTEHKCAGFKRPLKVYLK